MSNRLELSVQMHVSGEWNNVAVLTISNTSDGRLGVAHSTSWKCMKPFDDYRNLAAYLGAQNLGVPDLVIARAMNRCGDLADALKALRQRCARAPR